MAVAAGVVLFGALFLYLLFALTRDRMRPPPPETRSPPAGRR